MDEEQKLDFLIVGQGIAGTLLALELWERGYQIRLYDDGSDKSSRAAAGLYNPITGRQMKETWMAEKLFPLIVPVYRRLEELLQVRLLYETPIYRPFETIEEQNDWLGKDSSYLLKASNKPQGNPDIHDPIGGLWLKSCGWVDLEKLVMSAREFLVQKGLLIAERLGISELNVTDHQVSYKIHRADRIVFCEGTSGADNPFWRHLRFRPVRGDILHVNCNLSEEFILNRKVFILPRHGTFWVGSTYDHQKLTNEPQPEGLRELEARMKKIYKGWFEVTGAHAGVRPATHDRRPYIGWHREEKRVGIFNGFGAKGVSLVPYFSKLFVDTIETKIDIPFEADVSRL